MLESRLESTGCRRRILPDGIRAAVPSSPPDWSVSFFLLYLSTACVASLRARSCVYMCLYVYVCIVQGQNAAESLLCFILLGRVRARAIVTTPSSGGVDSLRRRRRFAGWPFGVCASAVHFPVGTWSASSSTPLFLERLF